MVTASHCFQFSVSTGLANDTYHWSCDNSERMTAMSTQSPWPLQIRTLGKVPATCSLIDQTTLSTALDVLHHQHAEGVIWSTRLGPSYIHVEKHTKLSLSSSLVRTRCTQKQTSHEMRTHNYFSQHTTTLSQLADRYIATCI